VWLLQMYLTGECPDYRCGAGTGAGASTQHPGPSSWRCGWPYELRREGIERTEVKGGRGGVHGNWFGKPNRTIPVGVLMQSGASRRLRFVYDGVAPSASAVRATCEALVAAGHTYITLVTLGPNDPRAAQPLLPVGCALALLPANCRHLAAPCVRHLMQMPAGDAAEEDGAGPPRFDDAVYYDLYGDCPQCRAMTAEVAQIQRVGRCLRQGGEGKVGSGKERASVKVLQAGGWAAEGFRVTS
jgi:hypothetical protein